MKKILCFLLILSFIFTTTVFGDAYSEEESVYEYLRNVGTTEEFLNNTPYEELKFLKEKMVNSGKFYEFINNENEIGLFSNIPSSDMTLTIDAYLVRNQPGAKVDEVLVINSFKWLGSKPTIHSKDAIAINWDSNIFAFQSGSFSHHTYCNVPGPVDKESMTEEFFLPAKSTQGGLGFYVSTMGDTPNGITQFTLIPNIEMNAWKVNNEVKKMTNINTNYVHSVLLPSITIYGVTVSVSGDAASSYLSNTESVIYYVK